MNRYHFYRPADGHGLPHDPLGSIIAPRPIGWISTVSEQGVRNLAPYSFSNLFNYRPPILGFASVGRKDSLANVEATGEFVWNLATRPLADAMNATSTMERVDEFDRAGLAEAPSQLVRPPRVAASPVHFECKVTQILRLQGLNGVPVDTWLVLGEAVGIHIDSAMLEDGIYRTERARPILRAGGPADYFEIGEDALFRMSRPAQ
ncbi:MAG: flavin reductase family protein [Pseudomonadota bacterium]